jgi:hypothetical protein
MAEIRLKQRSDTPAAAAENVVLFTDTSGNLNLRKPDGNILELAAAGNFTLTIPATGTAALLGTAQTFSAAQTFSTRPVAGGITALSDGTAAIVLTDAAGTPVITVDTTNDKVITAGDVFPFSDTAGVFARGVNQYQTPTDHFTAFSGWTWQTDAGVFAGAPSNVDLTGIPSWVRFWNQGVGSSRHFAAQTVSGTTIIVRARIAITTNGYGGIRIDDGSNANYLELRMAPGSSGGAYVSLSQALMIAGTETVTLLADDLPIGAYVVQLIRFPTDVRASYSLNFTPRTALQTSEATWSGTRAGLIGFNIPGVTTSVTCDWIEIT